MDSGFQKGLDFRFLSVLMLFFALRFCVRILQDAVRKHIKKFIFFFDLQITGRNVLQFLKGL